MPRLYLVRHGQAAAGFDGALDPGLSALGRNQAEAAAEQLAPLGPLPVVTSPLARARQTAEPFERRWGTAVAVEPRVAEIPSPTDDLVERARWLHEVMAQRWSVLDPALQRWRADVLAALGGLTRDTVVTTHFIVVNVAIGAATDDDRMVCAVVDNASVTVVDTDGDRLELVEIGRERTTDVR